MNIALELTGPAGMFASGKGALESHSASNKQNENKSGTASLKI